MLNYYLKIARKQFYKNKFYTAINVFGLVTGMLSALIIAKYIGATLYSDSFHENKNNLFSISQEESGGSNSQRYSNSTYLGVADLVNQYPEVVATTRYGYHIGSLVIARGAQGENKAFFEDKIFSVDPDFLNMFSFSLLHGDRASALKRPGSIVICQSAAERYFGKEVPLGKTLTLRTPWGSESVHEVTGVVYDPPLFSQFDFQFLIAYGTVDKNELWYVPDYPTFLLLKPDTDVAQLTQKLSEVLHEHPELKASNKNVKPFLEPLAGIRLSKTEYVLVAVGIFITVICWINFINQVIAQSYWRKKEIAIMRVMGATRQNLKAQFIVEGALTCIVSILAIAAIYFAIEPFLQSFTNGHLLPLVGDPTDVNLIFVCVFIAGTFLAAVIPTVILVSPDVSLALRSMYINRVGGVHLRHVLVVLQFSVSTILIIGVLVISRQMRYMERKSKGIVLKDVLVVQSPLARDTTWDVKRETVEQFKAKVRELSFVDAISASTTVPSEEYRQEVYLSVEGNSDKAVIHQNGVDEDFFPLYEIEFLAGRNFVANARWKNRSSIILNESAARALGISEFDKAINTKIRNHETDEVYELAGIVKDYHQTSLKFEIKPIAFKYNGVRGHYSLKVSSKPIGDKLNLLKAIWDQAYPDVPLNYFFLEDKFSAQDTNDRNFGTMFNWFAVLSIVISCLGLFGLSFLISTKRQREIGVRKIFGASSSNILTIFCRGYLIPLFIAIAIGTPIAYVLMNLWLTGFAYRTEIDFEVLATAWAGLALIFVLTISYHTIRSAMANPIKALRD